MEKYHFIKEIGHGTFGEVWLVKCANTNKKYVLKRINFKRASTREQRAAYQEAKLLSTIKHPNIVSYLDSFHNSEGSLFIVMGYCEFGDLYTYIRKRDGLYFQEEQIIHWFVQICMALKYLHDKNILHRDLKTQNIFLTRQKLIKVGDFGIARILNDKQDMATTLVGTPYYMSPEIFSGRPYNQKSDVWAVGCCIYEVATLKHAFNAHDLHSLMRKVLKGKVLLEAERYSADFWNIISTMLDPEPEKRPSVTDILLNDFIKTHILFFLQHSAKRTKSAVNDSPKEITNAPEPESILPPLCDNTALFSATECKNINECTKTVGKQFPDINGNGDGNDNSQEVHAKYDESRKKISSSKPNVLIYDGVKLHGCEKNKKNSQSVDRNISFKENMRPKECLQTSPTTKDLHDPSNTHRHNCSNFPRTANTTKANSQKSFKLLNNLTYTLKNTRLSCREIHDVETNVPKTSQGLVLCSKGKGEKLLSKRQSVSANISLACTEHKNFGGHSTEKLGCREFSEAKLNGISSMKNVDGGLLQEIMECSRSVKNVHSANSAARQHRREMKRQKAKNELAKLDNFSISTEKLN